MRRRVSVTRGLYQQLDEHKRSQYPGFERGLVPNACPAAPAFLANCENSFHFVSIVPGSFWPESVHIHFDAQIDTSFKLIVAAEFDIGVIQDILSDDFELCVRTGDVSLLCQPQVDAIIGRQAIPIVWSVHQAHVIQAD